jgi:demethylspheroidene O-methyltransferase
VPQFSLSELRNRLLTRPAFRSWAQKIPIFQLFARRQSIDLFRLCSGFIHSQILLACVRLELFERLKAGPLGREEIARAAELPASRCDHLLRSAAALGLLERRRDGTYGLGLLGATLVDNEALLALVRHHALLYEDLREPVALFAGAAAETRMSRLWPYADANRTEQLAADDVADYSALMAESQAMIAEQVLAAVSLRGRRRLLDIGGGLGVFVSAVAERWPELSLTLADLPAVAELARRRLTAARLDHRVEVLGVDAAADALPGGFDVVSLVRILHDHDDERVLALLAAARRSLAPDGMLLIAEPLAGKRGAGPWIDAYFHVYLLAMGSGRPRDFRTLSALLRRAGFGRVRRRRAPVPLVTSVVTAEPD